MTPRFRPELVITDPRRAINRKYGFENSTGHAKPLLMVLDAASRAAQYLDISRKTLIYRMEKFGLK